MSHSTVESNQLPENAIEPAQPHSQTASASPIKRFAKAVVGSIPTLVVLTLLAVVGWYGHVTHWQLASFDQLTRQQTVTDVDWCESHGVPESICVNCRTGLMPPETDFGWCREHGVHNCVLHHPELAQLKTPATPLASDLTRTAMALNMRERHRNNAACKLYLQRIQFASTNAVLQAGIDVELVSRGSIIEGITGNGEIRYDATRFANLSSRVPGTIAYVLHHVGDRVQEGEVLAIVDAMEVGKLKSELVKAIVAKQLASKNLARLSQLTIGVVPAKEKLEAEAALDRAEADVLSVEQSLANLGLLVDAAQIDNKPKEEIVELLRFLGIPDSIRKDLRSQTATANLIPVRSPMSGVIVEQHMVSGEVVTMSDTLFEVADPSHMWLLLNVPLENAHMLQLGSEIQFTPNAGGHAVSGRLTWISTAADRQTRMVKVRADLENANGSLRDEVFGTGEVILRKEDSTILVPKSAVHWEGCCQVVFVRNKDYFASESSPKVFHLRSVRTGAVNGDSVEILAGLLPGEVIVSAGSDVLRAQLLKNSLGEGCCAE